MKNPVAETSETLKRAREKSSSAIVAFSGGKDSLCVMDMACRTFDHVIGLYKYCVPGLQSTEDIIEPARKRWGVKIYQYLAEDTIKCLREGIWCNAIPDLPELTSWNTYASVIRDTGIPIVLTGMKRSDSQSRRRLLKWNAAHEHLIHPIAGWEKRDVLGYLRTRGIPIPASSGQATTGVGLNPIELLFLYDHYPDDFEKIRQYFPFIECLLWNRTFYGEHYVPKRGKKQRSIEDEED